VTIDDALDIADNEGLTPKENYVALTALAAEVRRYQAMRCKTCKYSHWPGPGRMACKLYRCMVTPDHGCLAWEGRDE
jgi:hypothetical protein